MWYKLYTCTVCVTVFILHYVPAHPQNTFQQLRGMFIICFIKEKDGKKLVAPAVYRPMEISHLNPVIYCTHADSPKLLSILTTTTKSESLYST